MQQGILSQLHEGHQGVEKTRWLARESVYWVNINKDREHACKSCDVCQEHQEVNKREPLMPHDVPARPWQYIASDIFEIDRQYLLIVDRYTKYPMVDELRPPVTSKAIADKLNMYCALFGRKVCQDCQSDYNESPAAWRRHATSTHEPRGRLTQSSHHQVKCCLEGL